jgi:NADH dehydrogenase/NADH:ubiquinone oxidoreductase subunit G
MADLTALDEKLGEVLGLAQAAQDATKQVSEMEDAEDFQDDLERMSAEAAETERRTDALVNGIDGKKTAIREKARETKSEAVDMMKTYLAGEDEALDGFEFLTMAEAGEVGHWAIVKKLNERAGDPGVAELAAWALPIQEDHLKAVLEGSLALAAQEDPQEVEE